MALPASSSEMWPRAGAPPSYRVQPPTPGQHPHAHGLTTPRPRRKSGWNGAGTPPPASPLACSPRGSGRSTPRHAHKISTSSSLHSLRHSSSNGSLRGGSGGLPRSTTIPASGSHGSLSMAAAGRSPSYPSLTAHSHSHTHGSSHAHAHAAHAHAHAHGYSLSNHLPSPVTETNEVVDPAELRPSPPSSHLASSAEEDHAGSAFSDGEEDYDSQLDEDYDEHVDLPCQFYGYAPAPPESETLYAQSACGCCVPAAGPGYDLVLADPADPYSYSYPPSPYPESMPKKHGLLTGLAHRAFYTYVVPYLPADIQAILADPPDLSRPQSLVPLLRAVAPYTQYFIVLAALYIVYAFVTGMVGYVARFIRFCFRIGPVIAIIAWIMAASGQGGIEVIFEALKQYAGLTPANPTGAGARGAGAGGRAGARGAYGQYGQYQANPHARTRRQTQRERERQQQQQQAGPDLLSAVFGNPATGQDGLAASVQDYVKAAVARGLGLEWLLGATGAAKEEEVKGKRAGGARTR